MHKIKNKSLLSIFMAGIISYTCLGINNIYANEDTNKVDSSIESSNNSSNEEQNTSTEVDNNGSEESAEINLKDILVNDINDTNNIGLSIKTQGSIIKIEENKIYIKDDSGEGIVYLNNIVVNNMKIGDCISVIGIVTLVEDKNVVTVDDVNNIDLVLSEDNLVEDDKEENSDNVNGNENNKPNTDIPTTSKPSNNQIQAKPNNNINTSMPSNNGNTSNLDIEEVVINTIKGKEEIVIDEDLTSTQWEKVKSNLEEGNIKVKDLKNNKIRITRVNKELGDNIWIVNDPRMLDLEESQTVKNYIIDTIIYSEYNVSESKWNNIVEDVESGSAKIKYDIDNNIKVIYQKSNSNDYTITLNRI